MTPNTPALVVGFAAEARVARLCGWRVAIGGGTTAGAARATQRLIAEGATGIVSFGLAGGLDPALSPGSLVVAEAVAAYGRVWRTDSALCARLGGTTGHLSLGLDRVVVSADEKRELSQQTGASLVDMESGAVAVVATAARVPFAVLRAVCDSADRALPPAALVALDAVGRLGAVRMAKSILTNPGQLGALFGLARDAAAARRSLKSRALRIAPYGTRPDRLPPNRDRPRGNWPDGLRPEAALPAGRLPEETWPEGMWPEGMWPEGMWPEGMWPEGILSDGMRPEGIL